MDSSNRRRIRVIEGNAKSLLHKSNLKKDFAAAVYFTECLQQHVCLKQQGFQQ
jgi:hypothetical protein